MEQPQGYIAKGKEQKVCKLTKSLYGLKQAPRQWYRKFEAFMTSQGYKRTSSDHCVFVKKFSPEEYIVLLLYVDDMLIIGKDMMKIERFKEYLAKAFEMKDLGHAKQILGIQIIRDRKNGKLWLSQEKYVEKVLKRFNMDQAKPVSCLFQSQEKLSKKMCPTSKEIKAKMSNIPYASVIGSLMYAMVCTRPDIAYAVGVASRYLANPGKKHWEDRKSVV